MLPAAGRHVYGSPMRAALHLLLMACVVWCALGLSEPAEAYAPGDRQHAAASGAPVDPAPDGDAADARGSVDRHHCPIAPDLPTGYLAERIDPAGSAPFRSPAIPLVSLTRAPPLQPPAAA